MIFILASGSPRRKELMHDITDDFRIVTADIDERETENRILAAYEKTLPMNKIAEIISTELAEQKAKAVRAKLFSLPDSGFKDTDYLIIGCDTSVALSDEILGKPKDRSDAVRMLRKESCEPQHVISGVCFLTDSFIYSFCEISKVYFNELDDVQERKIQNYCDTDEPYDKAGAYGIQLLGDKLVRKTEGEFNNIIGFPTKRIKNELKKLGLI